MLVAFLKKIIVNTSAVDEFSMFPLIKSKFAKKNLVIKNLIHILIHILNIGYKTEWYIYKPGAV